MPTTRELIESLHDGFMNLEYGDEVRLSKLQSRGEMILRNTHGVDSTYYKQFVGRMFSLYDTTLPPDMRDETWEVDVRETVNMFETMLEEIDLDAAGQGDSGMESLPFKSNRVFVVHGHDAGMRDSVARILNNLGLESIVPHEQPDRGRTIIEKFYDYSEVEFAVVLLSPDDMGYTSEASPDTAQPRARQNVILELGFFLGKLGRENVVALHKGNVEIPSDFSGVLFTPYVSGGDWPYKLTRELRLSGYEVSADDL